MKYDFKHVSIAIGFLTLNFLLSLLLFRIPLNILVPDVSLTIFLLGIATYYVLLLGGLWLIKTGFEKNTRRNNIAGVSIIQLANALFGAVILGFLPSEIHTIFLAILFMSIAIILTTLSMVVQWSQKSFSSLKKYTNTMLSMLALFVAMDFALFYFEISGFPLRYMSEVGSFIIYLTIVTIYIMTILYNFDALSTKEVSPPNRGATMYAIVASSAFLIFMPNFLDLSEK